MAARLVAAPAPANRRRRLARSARRPDRGAHLGMMPSDGEQPGDRGPRPAQVLRRAGGRARHRLQRPARRDLRPARAQRRRQDEHRRDPRGLPRPHAPAASACSATTRGTRPRELRERVGIVLQIERHLQPGARARGDRALRRLLPAPARRRRGDRAGRPERQARRRARAGCRAVSGAGSISRSR